MAEMNFSTLQNCYGLEICSGNLSLLYFSGIVWLTSMQRDREKAGHVIKWLMITKVMLMAR